MEEGWEALVESIRRWMEYGPVTKEGVAMELDRMVAEDSARERPPVVPAKSWFSTIGHSRGDWKDLFLSELGGHRIELLVDVRSRPFTNRAPWASQEALKGHLKDVGIGYVWMGNVLGGREMDWDESALPVLARLALHMRLCVMCSELDWRRCHRKKIAAYMESCGFDVFHHFDGVSFKELQWILSDIYKDGDDTEVVKRRLGLD